MRHYSLINVRDTFMETYVAMHFFDEWAAIAYQTHNFQKYFTRSKDREAYLHIYDKLRTLKGSLDKQQLSKEAQEFLDVLTSLQGLEREVVSAGISPRQSTFLARRIKHLIDQYSFLPYIHAELTTPERLLPFSHHVPDIVIWLTVLINKHARYGLPEEKKQWPPEYTHHEQRTPIEDIHQTLQAIGIPLLVGPTQEAITSVINAHQQLSKRTVLYWSTVVANGNDMAYTVTMEDGTALSISNALLSSMTMMHTIVVFDSLEALSYDAMRFLHACFSETPLFIGETRLQCQKSNSALACTTDALFLKTHKKINPSTMIDEQLLICNSSL